MTTVISNAYSTHKLGGFHDKVWTNAPVIKVELIKSFIRSQNIQHLRSAYFYWNRSEKTLPYKATEF